MPPSLASDPISELSGRGPKSARAPAAPTAPSSQRWSSKRWLTLGALAWLLTVVASVAAVVHYQTDPGAQSHAPLRWPSASRLQTANGRSTLLMFVHPSCSCSRASLAELGTIMREAHDQLRATVVFLPSGASLRELQRMSTWSAAGALANTVRVLDHDGSEAKRFGALTSGQVVLYDREHRLAFAGGITGSRGHAGDNMGRRSVLELVTRGAGGLPGHAVFGCPLSTPTAAPP